MKRTIKILMVAAFALASTALFAQKFGRIDYQTTLMLMPEMTTVNTELQKIGADYNEQYEIMVVERNKLMDEYQKLPETTTETARQLKSRAIMELEQRIAAFQQEAQTAIQTANMQQLLPLKSKLDAAIKKVSKAQGINLVFQTMEPEAALELSLQGFHQVAYYDEDAAVDINAAVRKELGIAADAVLPAAAQ